VTGSCITREHMSVKRGRVTMGEDTFRKLGARLRGLESENERLRKACHIALEEMKLHQEYEYGRWFEDVIPKIERALGEGDDDEG